MLEFEGLVFPMKLSIQIVHYRETTDLAGFLATIFQFPPSCSFEVIVVNNGKSTEKFRNLMDSYEGKVRLVQSDKNLGYGGGHRVGMQVSEGEYVAFCNCDLRCEKGSWDKLIDYLDDHPQVGIVGPQLVYPSGKVQESYRRFPRLFDVFLKRLGLGGRRLKKYLMADDELTESTEVDWLVGAVLVLPRRICDKTGGFDPRFFLFFEDTDLCRSVAAKGYSTVYLPQSKFQHAQHRLSDGGSIMKSLRKKTTWWHLQSWVKYHWKWR
jgi:GT2 family glycosyltransferase